MNVPVFVFLNLDAFLKISHTLEQEVNISLEDVCHIDDPKSQELYHFAMNGKSFAIIDEHFPDMLQKVRNCSNENGAEVASNTSLFLTPDCVLCFIARVARHSVCQNGT